VTVARTPTATKVTKDRMKVTKPQMVGHALSGSSFALVTFVGPSCSSCL
jgi:hypothetical protein